jgi:cytidine deaminase
MSEGGRSSPGRPPTAAERQLFAQAESVAANAYAPYSGFRVGAAVTGPLGRAHLGVNVENASFPAGLCAERAALGAAVAAGERALAAVAVATADGRDAAPCGACLQALAELGDPDIIFRRGGEVGVLALHELLTSPFAALALAATDAARQPPERPAGGEAVSPLEPEDGS